MQFDLFISTTSNDELLGGVVRVLDHIDARDHFGMSLFELLTGGAPVVSVNSAITGCK